MQYAFNKIKSYIIGADKNRNIISCFTWHRVSTKNC